MRTYVTGPDGSTGVWFLSLDASRLGAVVVARTTYHLPYYWSRMRVSQMGPVISYASRRRLPGPGGARFQAAVEIGDPYLPGEASDLEHWLTARWRLYSSTPDGLRHALADHPPWPLHHAQLLHLDEDLVTAVGLPAPVGPPLVHWSPGVEVRIGLPTCTRARRPAERVGPPGPRGSPGRPGLGGTVLAMSEQAEAAVHRPVLGDRRRGARCTARSPPPVPRTR